MSLFLKFVYGVGLTPWEKMPEQPAGKQAFAFLAREEQDRKPPYGRALDLGAGSGIWSVELAKRGWEVTAVDLVPKAVRRGRERAREAGVEVQYVESDITQLQAAGVGSEFTLVLDFGAVHGLTPEQRVVMGREVNAVAAPDATLLMYAMSPGHRGPLPRGMSRADIESMYVGWTVVDEEALDTSGLPKPMQKSNPHWYRLRRS